jgi:O-antigen ligase
MFSSELDTVRHPLATRWRGIILGTLILVTVAAALVSARTLAFLFGLTVSGFLVDAALSGRLGRAVPARGRVFWHLAAFLVYAGLSTAWGMEPASALQMVVLGMGIALAALALYQLFDTHTRPDLLHMGEGVWFGFAVALVYLIIELLTDQAIKIWLYNALALGPGDLKPEPYFFWSAAKLVAISPDDLTRNMAPLTMMLWPVCLIAVVCLSRRTGVIMMIGVVILSGIVVLLSEHETSKLAYFCGLAVFAAAHLALRLTGGALATGWVIACLAVLPAALLAHRFDLHTASWLQASARHRIVIWNYTAEQVLHAPWVGVGARTTYVLGPLLEKEGLVEPSDTPLPRTLSVHSHSVYLQTWFELGIVGATLLTLLGLAILQAIRSLAVPVQPYVYATFASAAAMAASSYGMWQSWFMSLFGFTATLVGLGASLMATRKKAVA